MSPRRCFPAIPPSAMPPEVRRARRLAVLRLLTVLFAGWVVALALLEPIGRAFVRLFWSAT